jgi:hypothetical protein
MKICGIDKYIDLSDAEDPINLFIGTPSCGALLCDLQILHPIFLTFIGKLRNEKEANHVQPVYPVKFFSSGERLRRVVVELDYVGTEGFA